MPVSVLRLCVGLICSVAGVQQHRSAQLRTPHVRGSRMVELLAAGCCEFPKLNMFRKTIKHTCGRKIHQCDKMQVVPLSIPQLQRGGGVGGAWLCVLTLFHLTLG